MHSTFPITSFEAVINKLPVGEDGDSIAPATFR